MSVQETRAGAAVQHLHFAVQSATVDPTGFSKASALKRFTWTPRPFFRWRSPSTRIPTTMPEPTYRGDRFLRLPASERRANPIPRAEISKEWTCTGCNRSIRRREFRRSTVSISRSLNEQEGDHMSKSSVALWFFLVGVVLALGSVARVK